MKNINLYKLNDVFENRFYKMPKELFKNANYKKMSIESKVIYAFLLDRMELSKVNHWVNQENEIYLIFTRLEVAEHLNLSAKTVTKAFKELNAKHMIFEKRRGIGNPNIIFIGKLVESRLGESPSENRKFSESLP